MTPGRYKSLGMKLREDVYIFHIRTGFNNTLASRLRTFDGLSQSLGNEGENENLVESAQDTSLSFE